MVLLMRGCLFVKVEPFGLLFVAIILYAFLKFLRETAPGAMREDRRDRKNYYGLGKEYVRIHS